MFATDLFFLHFGFFGLFLPLFGHDLVDVGVEPVEEGGAGLGERPHHVELPLDLQLGVPHEEGEREPVLALHVLFYDGFGWGFSCKLPREKVWRNNKSVSKIWKFAKFTCKIGYWVTIRLFRQHHNRANILVCNKLLLT